MTDSSSRNAALAGAAIGSAMTLIGMWVISNKSPSSKSATSTRRSLSSLQGKTSSNAQEQISEIREEQLSRHTLYFGTEGMTSLKNASIVVVGVGGVGSHVANMLGRAGVGHIRLIDFDQVSVSSLNRHACATLQDVGTPKVTCMKNFLTKICPSEEYLRVEAFNEMYTGESGERLLNSNKKWDIVIDAIDDVPTKAALLAHCLKKNIRVFSCMGAGGKSDVTRLHISDLRTAAKDPLASKLRQSLRKILGSGAYLEDMEQLTIIYSSEKPVVKLADFTAEQKEKGVHQFGAVDGMRIRVLPVLGTMPAVMGQTLAAMALCELGGKPMSPSTGERPGKNVRNRMFQHLSRREEQIKKSVLEKANKPTDMEIPPKGTVIDGTWIGPVQIDHDDIVFLLDLWRTRCGVTGDKLGNVLEFVRWDPTKPSDCDNLVLMGVNALKAYDENGGRDSVPKDIQNKIERRLASCRNDDEW